MGVVYLPCFDELYWAVKGQGAFRQNGMTVEKITATTFGMEDEGLKVVASRSHLNEETAAFINKLRYPQTVSKGSSLKFLMLAMGEAQLYPRMAPTMEWDTAAAQIILEEAGGKVLQADNGLPMVYNKENMLNPNFIAYAKLRNESVIK
jgi:3'(2'), 5'-bisphosphate nucleotidase